MLEVTRVAKSVPEVIFVLDRFATEPLVARSVPNVVVVAKRVETTSPPVVIPVLLKFPTDPDVAKSVANVVLVTTRLLNVEVVTLRVLDEIFVEIRLAIELLSFRAIKLPFIVITPVAPVADIIVIVELTVFPPCPNFTFPLNVLKSISDPLFIFLSQKSLLSKIPVTRDDIPTGFL